MAQVILFNVTDRILGLQGSACVQEVGLLWGVKRELEKLGKTVSAIKAVLLDAEKKQNHNHQIKVWLQRLQQVVLDADDFLDRLSYEGLRQSLMPGNNMVKQVRTFFSSSNQLAFWIKYGHKIRQLRKKLAAIATDRIELNLEEHYGEARVLTRLRDHTHSFVSEKEVIGRDDDKMAILQILLDTNTKENLSVIPIVGIGGLGKTTLAQMVFNDEQVQKHFDLRLWVYVSEDFDVKLLVQKIIKSSNTTVGSNTKMEQLQKIMRERLYGKRYLFVLDNVSNEINEKWHNLKSLLLNDVEGSKIIVTTRRKVVARITGTMAPYDLKIMDKEKSWTLFKKIALQQGQESNISSNILEIGMDIVEKCGGIPLAIKAIGGVLRFKNPETEWSSFNEKELLKISQTEDDILPTLKLSYDHLTSNLKHCFAYCSLFPKDYVIDVQMLVSHWMAQDFIKVSDPSECLEDVGYEYFIELLRRCFFEEVETGDEGKITKCKMHDLMHDLAKLVTQTENDMLNESRKTVDSKTRHVSFYAFNVTLLQEILPSLIQAKKMRTIVRPVRQQLVHEECDKATCHAIASNLKLLRTLDLHFLWMNEVPNSIGKLKHLRYLDLSENTFETLSNCITELHYLQTLKLNRCFSLRVLPKDISKLINLRSLELDGCDSLIYMPHGLGELTSLCILSKFTLSKDISFSTEHQSDASLDELMRLNNLRGKLSIENLGGGKDAILQSKLAHLKQKQHLRSLDLCWYFWGYIADETEEEAEAEDHKMQLEGLQPHPNLKHLTLSHYHGFRFPSWFHLHTNMVTLCLRSCAKCKYLPPVHQFPYLKELILARLYALEYVSNNDLSSSSPSIFFPSLEKLVLDDLCNLEGWWRRDIIDDNSSPASGTDHMLPIFPNCLSQLIIKDCPSLTCMPLFPYVSQLVELNGASWIPFRQTILSSSQLSSSSTSSSSPNSPFSKLTTLRIHKIDDLQFLPHKLKSLTSLKELEINNCPQLKSLYPGIQHLISLQHLEIENCMELDMIINDEDAVTMWQPLKGLLSLRFDGLPKLVDLPRGFQHLTSLQTLQIVGCDNLVSLPAWIGTFISLQQLYLSSCQSLASLPEEISSLTSLKTLEIWKCDTLLPRCQMEKGEDWPKIAHILDLRIIYDNS
ncbi:putative disease resistance protein RGA3 [Ziziphus jujuba]|uniref:Disease resistance protein RGA3 n=1 Tax=Ziziphus jujuba TaxID=326968 RepID=A0A6P4ASG9_ZIZJJ|nr:putative disease resistance protein RGA3 [Ziziphus jujuba]XP_048335842.2 putative disease resistance protein RGA3 [Ziziphus jujuba]XP_060675229.1 putative disease resistance protein RGA3 [Ziziphus jujuba]XP_060675230.1 putative disease resistance protein RGA3 [Ziziphus jujuba]